MPTAQLVTAQLVTAAEPLAAGRVVWMADGLAQPFVAGPNGFGVDIYARHRGAHPLGITLAAAEAKAETAVQILGTVDGPIATLGPGARSMVGWDENGVPARAPDAACVSHPNYVGWCDETGTVFVEPAYRPTSFDVRDFGATGDGIADDTAAVEAALAAAARLNTTVAGRGLTFGGGVVYVPSGQYRITRSLVLPSYTRMVGESMHTALLYFHLPETGEVEVDPYQGSGIVCASGNGHAQTGVEELAIIGAWQGTAGERAKRLGAGVLFKGGGPLGLVRRCAIEGWRVGVWFDAVNIATVEQCNIGGHIGAGYPDGWSDEADPAEAYPLSVKTWGIWLAAVGSAASVDSVDSHVGSIVGGETLVLAYDGTPDDTLSESVTITFQPGDTTIAAVAGRINAYLTYPCASDFVDTDPDGKPVHRLRLSGRKPSWWSRVKVVGGSGLAKLGLTAGTLGYGFGSGLGNQELNASSTCNLVSIRLCQFNGPHVGIHLEDGIGHTVESCNFNTTPRVASIHGGLNPVFRKCIAEGCSSTGYFYVVTSTGLTIESCQISGFWPQNELPSLGGYARPGQTAFVEFAPGSKNHHVRIRDNMITGSTGPDGRYPCSQVNNEAAPYALLGQVDIHGNTGAVGDRFVGPFDVADSSTFAMNDDRRGCLGIGTVHPEAQLDISPTYTPYPGMRFRRQIRGGRDNAAVEALSLDDATREHGLGRHSYDGGEIQQGMVEVLRRGDWAAGVAETVVHIDVRRHTVCDFEISVLMRSAASADAKRWRFHRLLYWDAGTAHLDDDLTEDTERTIGAGLSWLAPEITIDPESQRLAVAIRAAVTPDAAGTWIVRMENLQRSLF